MDTKKARNKMAGCDYYWCPVCEQKALYIHEGQDDVVVLHKKCMKKLKASIKKESQGCRHLKNESKAGHGKKK